MTGKAAMRAEALRRRDAVEPEARAALAARLAEAGPGLARSLGPGAVASAFLPIRGEPDTLPLIEALAGAGIATALPATPPRGAPLRFRAWAPGAPLRAGRYGTREPGAGAAEVEPDLLFVPLLAFDGRGARLGYGAGFYDGALARLRAGRRVLAVGVAFACQRFDAVPSEPHDARLDAVLTEHGLTDFAG